MALTKISRSLLDTGVSDSSDATAITIDSSERVGLGTASPASVLHIYDGGSNTANTITFGNPSVTAEAEIDYNAGGSEFLNISAKGTTSGYGNIVFKTGGTPDERMRIDATGNVLIGTTSTGFSDRGVIITDGQYVGTMDGSHCMTLNRLNSDGLMLRFFKDDSLVGSIGTSGLDLTIGTGDTGITFHDGVDSFIPWNTSTLNYRDNAIDLGTSNYRFKDIYRAGSTYTTSDQNMKQDIRDLTSAERNVAVACKGLLKAFRFIDDVNKNGDKANIHFGIIAQELAEAFEAQGLDANDYQVYKSTTTIDDDVEEQTTLNICYENLLAFIISAI